MNFLRWRPLFPSMVKNGYMKVEDGRISATMDTPMDFPAAFVYSEYKWIENSRPYYRVYPSIEDLLLSTSLDVPVSSIRFPIQSLTIEFSDSGQFANYTLLVAVLDPENDKLPELDQRMLYVTFSSPKDMEDGYIYFPITDRTVDECLQDSELLSWRQEEMSRFLRLFIGACMLSDDPMLIEPIVLNRDAIKYKTASLEQRQKMEDRAARLNGRGWAIGKGFEEKCETSPHFRKSHLALFWTGKGRTIPRLQLRKGCLVKSRKLTEIPTGYYDEED